MEMGRQISVPAGWAKEKGASWNQGESASCVEGAHRVGSSGGGGFLPSSSTDLFAQFSERS